MARPAWSSGQIAGESRARHGKYKDGNGGQGKPGGANADGPSRGMLLLAEVKFLKLWQEDLNRRTQQLDMDAARRPPEDLRERHARLAEEQASLAAATLQLHKPQNAEADLPDDGADEK